MPDENKFAKLREIEYTVPVTCGLCKHGKFSGGSGPVRPQPWGECDRHRYKHLRQDNPEGGRGVSIHVSGTCGSSKLDVDRSYALGAHAQFLITPET